MRKLTMKGLVVFLLCILGLLKASRASDDEATTPPLVVEIFNFDNCKLENGEMYPMSFENITMRMNVDTKQLFISGGLDMKVPWTNDLGGHLTISKCLAKDDVNSCTKYFEKGFDDLCIYLPDKTKDWSPFVKQIKGFDPHCPVKAGIYSVFEAPLSTGKLENMKSALGIWQLAFAVWKGDKKLLCTDSGVEIKRARRSRKKTAAPVEV